MKIHIVQKGDTLWKIAKKYGVNFEELKKMNSQLSNPDMIMPGMKVKVPTTGGTIKKEAPLGKPEATINLGAKKEMPIAEHPFAKEKPIPKQIVEAPKKEVPIIKEAPIKEAPIIKEAPKVPYTPKMPVQVVPEIDINNYYMTNMTNMTVQPQLPPKPANILPEVKEVPKKELPVVQPPPVVTPPPVVEQPVIQDYCVPVTPVMPGPGFCPPFEPFMPFAGVHGAAYPPGPGYMPGGPGFAPVAPGYMPGGPGFAPAAPAPGYMPGGPGFTPAEPGYYPGAQGFDPGAHGAPMAAGASHMPQHFDDESSSFMPQMPAMNPGYNPGAVMGAQNPAYGQTPYMAPQSQYPMSGFDQVPTGYPAGPGGYPEAAPAGYPGNYPTGYPAMGAQQGMEAPYGMEHPYGQMPYGYPQMGGPVPHGMGAAYPEAGMPPMGAQMPYMQQPYQTQGIPVGTGALGDCGCGPAPSYAPMPTVEPISNAVPNAVPPNFVPPTPPIYSAPYSGPVNTAQPPFMNPYGMGADGAYGMPRYDDESMD